MKIITNDHDIKNSSRGWRFVNNDNDYSLLVTTTSDYDKAVEWATNDYLDTGPLNDYLVLEVSKISEITPNPHIDNEEITVENTIRGMIALSRWSHSINRKNGFWEDWDLISGEMPDILEIENPEITERLRIMFINEKLMLTVSELSEAMEGIRKGGIKPDDKLPQFSNLSVELADTVIRVLDLAEGIGLVDENGTNEVLAALVQKLKINAGRGYKHGGKSF